MPYGSVSVRSSHVYFMFAVWQANSEPTVVVLSGVPVLPSVRQSPSASEKVQSWLALYGMPPAGHSVTLICAPQSHVWSPTPSSYCQVYPP